MKSSSRSYKKARGLHPAGQSLGESEAARPAKPTVAGHKSSRALVPILATSDNDLLSQESGAKDLEKELPSTAKQPESNQSGKMGPRPGDATAPPACPQAAPVSLPCKYQAANEEELGVSIAVVTSFFNKYLAADGEELKAAEPPPRSTISPELQAWVRRGLAAEKRRRRIWTSSHSK